MKSLREQRIPVVLVSFIISSLAIFTSPLPHRGLAYAANFNIGDTVEVYNAPAGLYVRGPNKCDPPINPGVFNGARGVVLSGPEFCDGYNRWKVAWNDGQLGWSSEGGLRLVSTTDTTPPTIAITSPVATGGTYNTSTATVNVSGTASDNVGVGVVIWDNNRGGGTTASGTTNWSATGIALQSGANIITVHAYDAAGNTRTASITVNYTTVTVTPTPPTPSSPSGSQVITTLTPQLTWSGGSNFSSLQINMSKSPYGGCPGTGNCVYTSAWLAAGTTSIMVSLPAWGTSYRWDVTACSGANGTAPCVTGSVNAYFSTQVTSPPADTTPPTVSVFSVTPSSLTVGSAFTISYTVSDTGGSGLWQMQLFRTTDSNGVPVEPWTKITVNSLSGNGPVSGSFIDAPPSAGTYWYGGHGVDNAGNKGYEPSGAKVVVNAAPPPAVPAIPTGLSPGSTSSPGPTLGSSAVTVSWNASSGATFYIGGITDIATGSAVVTINTTSATSTDATMSPGKQYRWYVYACNSSGCSSSSALYYFQTPPPTVPITGTISGLTATPSSAQVNQSVTFTVSGTGTCGGLSLTFGDGASTPLSGSFPVTATHAYASAGTFTATATGTTSCTGSASAPVTVTTTASIVWTTPPPSSVTSGAPFTVAWSISGGSPTHVNVHWDPMNPGGPGNPSGNIDPNTCQPSSTSCSTNTPTSNPAPLTAPTVTTSTVVRYLVHATVNGTDIFTDTRLVTVNPIPVTTGNLTVTVRRSDTNALLSGATVMLSGGPSSPPSQPTGTDGTATFTNIAIGSYTATASMAGFQSNNAPATVVANPTTSVEISLMQDSSQQTEIKITVIAHGFNSDTDGWVEKMAEAIQARKGGQNRAKIYNLTVEKAGNNSIVGGPLSYNTSMDHHIVKIDWRSLSGNITDGDWSLPGTEVCGDATTLEVAAAVYEALKRHLPAQTKIKLQHLIGHSRGGSLVAALAWYFDTKDQNPTGHLTTLDPHPFGGLGSLCRPDAKPEVYVPSSVGFWDNYYETGSIGAGGFYTNAWNLNLDNAFRATNQFDFSLDHLRVHAYYYGTIDLAATTDGTSINYSWYGDTCYPMEIGYQWAYQEAGRPSRGVNNPLCRTGYLIKQPTGNPVKPCNNEANLTASELSVQYRPTEKDIYLTFPEVPGAAGYQIYFGNLSGQTNYTGTTDLGAYQGGERKFPGVPSGTYFGVLSAFNTAGTTPMFGGCSTEKFVTVP